MKHFFWPTVAFTLILSACQQPVTEHVSDAVVKLPAVAGHPGAGYFTLHGGAERNKLVQVSSPQVGRVELHESIMKGGMMSMSAIEGGIDVPIDGEVKFQPGGKHAMLFEIDPKVTAGAKVKLNFAYSSGKIMEVDAEVKAAGDMGSHQH